MPSQIVNETINLAPDKLLEKVIELKNNGYRIVQICCSKTDVYTMDYSFDKDYKFLNLKIQFESPVELTSITDIFPGAFLYENEIHELFGLVIKGINIDYKGTLYKTKQKNAFVLDNLKQNG
jgi:ech hydrogenase subunit D